VALFVLALPVVVHLGSAAALERRGPSMVDARDPATTAKPLKKPRRSSLTLPVPVEEMRQALLSATQTGDIEDLREPLEWNELKPDIGKASEEDVIAHWRSASADGQGLEILAVLADILPMPPAELPFGPDIENNIIYVWPYLAEAELDKLTPREKVDLMRLVGAAEAKKMQAGKKWTWWRLTIGADGTWHSFKRSE
jgi:hypothetical protein